MTVTGGQPDVVLSAEDRAQHLIGLIGNTCMAEPDTAAVASAALSELAHIFEVLRAERDAARRHKEQARAEVENLRVRADQAAEDLAFVEDSLRLSAEALAEEEDKADGFKAEAESLRQALREAHVIYEAECKDWIDTADPSDPDEAPPPWQGRWAKYAAALAAADATQEPNG